MDFKTINFWPKKFENSKFLQQQGQQKLQQWKKNYFNQNLISLSKKLNQRSCPSAEPAKSHKKLKKKNKFCHTNESEWDAKTEAKPTTQVYTTLQNTTQGQWLRLIHFGWNKFK